MMGTLISTIVLLIFRQVTHTGTGSVLLDGVAYAAGFFFAYLIAQEVDPDPDRRWGALVSAFLTLAAEALLGVNPDGVVALLWMLLSCVCSTARLDRGTWWGTISSSWRRLSIWACRGIGWFPS